MLFKSNGDTVVAFSSGFTIGKTSTPTAPLIKPANLSIENGINPGELVSNVNRVKVAVSYLQQFATDTMLAQQNWQSVPSSKTRFIIADLQPGTKYNCRVAVLGVKGQLVYSDIVSRIVA